MSIFYENSDDMNIEGSDVDRNSFEDNSDEQNENEEKIKDVRVIKSYLVLGVRFDVDIRYTIFNAIGKGAYGVVCAARDDRAGTMVAIKKISGAFHNSTFIRRTLREIRLLRLLQHDNLINIITILKPIGTAAYEDIYILSDLMETDLSSIIKSPQQLSESHLQFFVYQILKGLRYLHSCNVVHRDLKPRNILVNSNCDLKICDFGLARLNTMNTENQSMMTDYVATRWYRAPEVIISLHPYGSSMDMWSVGCILAELVQRRPLFPGRDGRHQLSLILSVLGCPDESIINRVENEKVKHLLRSAQNISNLSIENLFNGADQDAIEFLKRLLRFDPDERCTASEALRDYYLQNLYSPTDEIVGIPIDSREFYFDSDADMDIEILKEEIHKEIQYHNPSYTQSFNNLKLFPKQGGK